MRGRPIHPDEIELVREFFPSLPADLIAQALERSVMVIYRIAERHGIKKVSWFEENLTLLGRRKSNSGQFQKGSAAWNAGKKGLTGQHPNTRRTQFKKGSMHGAAQHHYVPIGSLRIRAASGHLERKMTDDPNLAPARRWTGVHRLVWEAAHGPVPAGYRVAFKPGMHTAVEADITIDRLELLTAAEMMHRNTIHNYPREIVDAMNARGVLNRRINRERKQNNR